VAAITGLAVILAMLVTTPSAASASDEVPPPIGPPAWSTLTVDQASAQARATGEPVTATAATTATDTTVANPDGTVTFTRTMAPVRKRTGATWVDLDATLRANPDGTISPIASTAALTLSGGGTGPLATMAAGGHRLVLTSPVGLPAPVLDTDTATYPAIYPGVDLRVRVDKQGGFSEVLIVRDATAAANPAVTAFTLSTAAGDVTLSADSTGNITGRDATDQTLVTAPAPRMWDSSWPDAAQLDALPITPTPSTADGPGTTALTAPVGVSAGAGKLTLTASATLLATPGLTFPVFIDPSFIWSSTAGTYSGWATVSKGKSSSEDYSANNYWKNSPDPDNNLQVGNSGYGSGGIWSHSLINFSLPLSTLAGATINNATIDTTELYSYSCNAREVDLYAPSTTLTNANATWDYWAGVSLGSAVASANVAHGYNTSCPAGTVGFGVTNTVRADVAANKSIQTFALTAANESTDEYGYKEFDENSAANSGGPKLTITYNHAPNKPTGMTTSPTTACTASTPDSVGDGPITLYAPVSDPDKNPVDVTFQLWKTSTPGTILDSTAASPPTYASGTTAVHIVAQSLLENAAGMIGGTGGTITTFSWRVQTTDGQATSLWSATCSFAFDPTRPGAPQIPNPPAPNTTTIGTSATIHVVKPTNDDPAKYLYQLNAGAPATVDADPDGTTDIVITPTRHANTLTVSSVSASGNISLDAATVIFLSQTPAPAGEADLTGDHVADLLTVGAANNLPAGLWQAAGKNTGQILAAAVDIGANGNGASTVGSPADYNGAQAITGLFTDSHLQDVLIYYPATGAGAILPGNGDGSVLQTQISDYRKNIYSTTLQDVDGDYQRTGHLPRQVVNVGDAHQSGDPYPDLLAINGTTGSYHLSYIASNTEATFDFPQILTTPPPTGSDWSAWTLAAAQAPIDTAGTPGTWLYLWNKSTGALYLWKNLTLNSDTGVLSYTPYTLDDGTSGHQWNLGQARALQAADIDTDGTPDLWTVQAATTTDVPPVPVTRTTAWLVTGLTGTPTATARTDQDLTTTNHQWNLSDKAESIDPGTAITSSTDAVGALALTGTGNVTWNTGDLFDPDARLAGTTGMLATSGPAVTTNADLTIAAWVKPTTTGGTIVSQDGANTYGFRLWSDTTTKSWRFSMPRTDSTAATLDTAAAPTNTVQFGVWTQLTASYKAATGLMSLYVNGVKTATATHTTTFTATGGLRIGAHKAATTYNSYYAGQISTVQTWNQLVDPAQAQTPAGYYQPVAPTLLMDTRTGLGGTTGPIGVNTVTKLQITNALLADGTRIPTGNVTAVAVYVTAVTPTTNGFAIVYPDNTARPLTSNLNWTAGQTTANLVVVPVGTSGNIDIWTGPTNSTGTIQLLASVYGYYTADATATGDTTYTPVTPARIVNSLSGVGGHTGQIPAGGTWDFTVTGVGGVPTGAKAVMVNITATAAASAGYFTAWESGKTRPATSGLQYQATNPSAVLALVPVSSTGKISLYSLRQADVLIDVMGYFTIGTNGQKYHTLPATRMIDTRTDGGAMATNSTKNVGQPITIVADKPVLMLTLTVTEPTGTGFLIEYPSGITRPATSTLNYVTGQTIANSVAAATGTGGQVSIWAQTATQLVVDCTGYYSAD
jgi:hypothetical protein